jgi:hypothetical protein
LKQDDDSFYKIVDKDSIEIVKAYHDRWPCLNCRKSLMKFKVNVNRVSIAITTHGYFETASVMVIIANSLLLALDDPLVTEPPVY